MLLDSDVIDNKSHSEKPSKLSNHPISELFPMMTDAEFAGLKADIKEHGVETWGLLFEGKILDGRNRYKACQELGIGITWQEVELGEDVDKFDPVAYVLSHNLHRRHLDTGQRSMVAGKLATLKHGGDRKSAEIKVSNDTLIDDAAKLLNVSLRSVNTAKQVLLARPDMAEQVFSGELGMADAVRELNRAEVVAKLEDLSAKKAKAISGKYDVIVIDPPWPMEKIERDVTPNQVAFDYPTMQEVELTVMKIPAAQDCHLWLWTTHKFLPMAFRLLDAWGLKYVCTFVWHKPGGFQPFGLPQYNCEFALYARKGSPKFIDTKAFPVCFNAPRGAHSEKPEEFYDVVRRVTSGRRIDMFSRRAIEGFDGWGNEVTS